ncbi:putative peptidase C1A, papain, patatin-like phospholipase domain-containing protein [Helianthus debilis subsp. tardiflorus]
MIDQRRKRKIESFKSDRYSPTPADALPESVDWRERGAVAPVKDQGACGGSWAFSTIGSVEAVHHITTGELITLSEQQLLDCDTSYNKGCNGGDKDHAFAFILESGGIHAADDYPYTGKDEGCYALASKKKRKAFWIDGDEELPADHKTRKAVCIDGYEGLPANDEQSLLKAVANQPVSVSIEAGSRDFQFYSGGIFTGKCGTGLDHDVVVVGYGTEAGKNYWLVRNSWGADWGEQGYVRIERNVIEKTGKCGIAMEALYPVKNGQKNPDPVTPEHQKLSDEDSYVFGNLITILSIDGGGVRALLPTAALVFLEARIQNLLGKNVRLADVFDVITGTSTGGLVTAMLTTPDKDGRPMFTAKEVQNFYLKHAPEIFPPDSNSLPAKVIKALWGPKYDGVHLHKVIRKQLEERRLHETITNVVIPTYDIKAMKPVIFSSFRLKIDPSIDAKLSDICIATSAAPTYLPSHVFHYTDSEGKVLREFNLIDGGVAANNPAMVAVAEIIMERTRRDPTWSAKDHRFLVLSLGTGCVDREEKYDATKSSTWGIFGWLRNGGSSPLLDVFSSGYSYMADYFASAFLKALNSVELYLRIQDFTLSDDMASMDLATDENLENLVEAGEKLLKKLVTGMNLVTGQVEHDPHITNEMVIESFARILRDVYLAKSEMDKEERDE